MLVKDLGGVRVHLAELSRAGTDLGSGQFQTLKLDSDLTWFFGVWWGVRTPSPSVPQESSSLLFLELTG